MSRIAKYGGEIIRDMVSSSMIIEDMVLSSVHAYVHMCVLTLCSDF